jgi:hypothetical protein
MDDERALEIATRAAFRGGTPRSADCAHGGTAADPVTPKPLGTLRVARPQAGQAGSGSVEACRVSERCPSSQASS